ncbi:hypothetical protein [Pseudomonas sp. rhizo25]|uniref:hypothetical protein n=1 Tax=Pseudomonas sp. rhizo25 TaxID=3059675 RepID=UPI0028906386|nr:hypothetical protein [Pseudomonas sp. rhizo25]MDT3232527.1 hypothetical protein [Pseudomonas sp. rhizo25]
MSVEAQSLAITKDTLWYLLAKVIPAVATAYGIYLISQGIGTVGYGSYSTMIVVNLFLAQLFGGWLYQAAIVVGLRFKKFNPNFRSSLDLLLLLSISLAVISSLVIFYCLDYSLSYMLCGAALLASQMMIFFYQAQLQAYRLVSHFVWLVFLQFGIQTFLLVTFSLLEIMSFQLVIFSVSIAALLSALCYLLFSKKHLARSTEKLKFKTILKFTKLSWVYCFPVGIWLVFYNLYSFSDRVFMRHVGMDHELGMYSSSRDLLLGAVSIVSMPMLMALQPFLINTLKKTKNLHAAGELVAEKMNFLLFFGIILSGALLVNVELLGKIINEDARELGAWLIFSSLAVFLGAASVYAHKGMELSGRSWVMSLVGGVVVIVVLCMNAFAALENSLMFFSLANFSGQLIYFLILLYLSKDVMRIRLDVMFLLQATFVAVIMVLAGEGFKVVGEEQQNFVILSKFLVCVIIIFGSFFLIKKIRSVLFSLLRYLVR